MAEIINIVNCLAGGVVTPPRYGQKVKIRRPTFDFLTGTLPFMDKPTFEKYFPFIGKHRREGKGLHGYTDSHYYESGTVMAFSPLKPNHKTYFSFSGQTLGYFKEFYQLTAQDLINALDAHECTFTRVDIAIDEKEQILDLDVIYDKLRYGEVSSRLRTWREYTGSLPTAQIRSQGIQDQRKIGRTIYIGDLKTGNVIFRIYDKAAERGLSINDHWIRVELQLRREAAEQFLQPYKKFKNEKGEIEKERLHKERNAKKIFMYYLRFLEMDNNEKKRCSTSIWWETFLQTRKKESIGLPKYQGDLDDLYSWYERSISGLNYLLEKADPERYEKITKETGEKLFNENKKYKTLYANNRRKNTKSN